MATPNNQRARNTAEFKRNRQTILAEQPVCYWCRVAPATEADHLTAIADGGSNDISNLVGACKPCNARRGQATKTRKEREKQGQPVARKSPASSNEAAETTQSGQVFFVDGSRKPPQNPFRISHKGLPGKAPITNDYPRLETTTPSGCRSLEAAIGDFAEKALGMSLMPWQRHVAHGMTAQDDAGDFYARTCLLSVARQNGKSLLAQATIGAWLTTIAAQRGKPQLVISVAHKLDLATALFKSLAPILEAKYGAKISWSYGRSSAELPDGSTWIVRAATPQAGHGYSADLVFIDEVWAVSEAAIDEGLIPSQTARKNPLMVMFSTAGTPESKAMLRWRDQGLAQIDAGEPGPLYFAEYSPPADLDAMSAEAWAYANPALGHTLELKTLEAMSKAPNRQAFLRASVNLWVSALSGWLEPGLFASCETDNPPPPGGVLAIEQDLDQGRYCGVRANQNLDGKTVVTVAFTVESMAALWAAVEEQIAANPELRLAIVPSLEVHCPPKYERRRTIWGYKELLRWTQPVRNLIVENRLAHTGELQLIEHVERAVMVKHQGSVALSSARSPGPIELARCMVVAAALSSRPSNGGKPLLVITKR